MVAKNSYENTQGVELKRAEMLDINGDKSAATESVVSAPIWADERYNKDLIVAFKQGFTEDVGICGTTDTDSQLVGIVRGAQWELDELTFDPIEPIDTSDVYDAHLGTFKNAADTSQFPHVETKCQGVAERYRTVEGLSKADSMSTYGMIFIGYDSHPFEKYGNIIRGSVLTDSVFNYYNDSDFAHFYIKKIGSSCKGAICPRISAMHTWVEDSVEIHATSDTMITVTQDEVVIHASNCPAGGFHTINVETCGQDCATPSSSPDAPFANAIVDLADCEAAAQKQYQCDNPAGHSCGLVKVS